MAQFFDSQELLEQVLCPVFIVENGIITMRNHAAQQRQIEPGTEIGELLSTGKDEYTQFVEGSLCLSLCVGKVNYAATVTRKDDRDVFYLESEYADPELRAFALASQALRDPLANALSSMDMMLSDPKTAPAAKQLADINRNLHQIHRVVCNMSDTAAYSAKNPALAETRDAVALLEELLHKVRTLATEAGKDLQYSLPNRPINTLMYTEKFERAVLNLISNALKYGSKDKSIFIKLEQQKQRLCLSVTNSIDNASASVYKNLFSYFLREPGIENTHSGIGLGITLVRNAAIAHGGTLLFDQPEPESVRFTLSVPIQRRKDMLLRSSVLLPIDYAGGYDHTLTELSDVLPSGLYE